MNRLLNKVARHRAEDGFAMLTALFMLLVIATVTIVVTGIFASETKPTRLTNKSVETVDAASAGLQAAIGVLRNTPLNVDGYADLTKLPCTDPTDPGGGVSILVGDPLASVAVPGDQITGTVDGTASPGATESYRVVISYYLNDPTSAEAEPGSQWSANTSPINCKAGLVNSVPSYAFIQSFGADSQVTGLASSEGDRTIHAIYQFSTTTTNSSAGGRIAEFIPGAQDTMCLDAQSTSPSVGSTPVMAACKPLGYPQQDWLYRSDLTIEYGGNLTLGGGKGLCIQNVSGSGPTKAGTPELEPCVTSGNATTYSGGYPGGNSQWEQEWAYDDNGHFQAPGSTGDVTGGFCLTPTGVTASQSASAGAALAFSTCGGSSTDPTSWDPDAQVGAGASGGNVSGVPGAPTNQYVNYALFGRCLDVNAQNFANDLIAFPCKQAPNTADLAWNQVWYWQAVGTAGYGIFYTNCPANDSNCAGGSTSSAQKDCLVSPGVDGQPITGAVCPSNPSSAPSSELWLPTGLVTVNDGQEDYLESYLLVNKLNAQSDVLDSQCMAADTGTINTRNGADYPEIIITACDGSQVPAGSSVSNYLLLKWNAPPYSPTPGLHDVQEDGGGVDATGNG